ncbi:MAG: hypothetical protein ACP5JG_17110 [Anaerolineae bacterium]
MKYQPPGSSATVVIQERTEIKPRGRVQLDQDGDALLLFYHPDQTETPIATIQLYNETEIAVAGARTPRFQFSPLPHRIEIQAERALNMQVTVGGDGRTADLRVETPQGPINMGEGSFKLVVDDAATDVSVSAGRAQVFDPATGERPLVVALQRTQMTREGLGDIYVGERDLLRSRNGNFYEPLEGTWVIYTDTAEPDQPGGSVRQSPIGNDNKVVIIERGGTGHAATGIRQEINRDIRGVSSLRVQAEVRVDTQTLPVCGSVGSECPLMIRIYFLDQESGTPSEWLQGFYAIPGDNPDFCAICPSKAEHIQVPGLGVWYTYQSEDLLPILREQGIDPATLHSVEIEAQGHVYGSAIDEIAILVGE